MKNRIIALTMIISLLSLTACGTQSTTSEPEPQTETISTESETETEPELEQISTEIDIETTSLEEETTETESKADEQLQSEAGQTTSEESNYTVTPMTATLYAQQAVNLRQGPGTNYDKTGSLSMNQSVEVTGYTDVASGKWYQLSNGSFVSSKYLKDTQVSTSTTTKPSTTNTNNTGNNNGGASNNTTSQPAQSSEEQTASPSGSGDGSGSSRENRSGVTENWGGEGAITGGNLQ